MDCPTWQSPARDRSRRSARGWCETRIGGDLPTIVEAAEQAFKPEERGELRTNAAQARERSRWGIRISRGGLRHERVPLRLDRDQLGEDQLEPGELALDLALEMRR